MSNFDENVIIQKLIDWKDIDETTLYVFDTNLDSRAQLLTGLVQEAKDSNPPVKLNGEFGKYIASLITLRQVIAQKA